MKHLKSLSFLLLFIITFNSTLFSQNNTQSVFKIDSISSEIPLNKFWKYQAGDDSLWAAFDYNDSEWDSLQPNIDVSKISEERFNGQGWFRLHLQIDSSLRNKIIALTINQQGASEIYLNGKLLESFGKVKTTDQEEKVYNPKYLPFLTQFTDTLDYVLAVRYSNLKAYENYRIYNEENAGFNFSISTHEDSVNTVASLGYVRNVFITILSVFCSIAFLHLLLFLFYRRQRSNLYFFLFMISISMMWMIILYTFSISEDPGSSTKILFYLGIVIAISFSFLSIFIYSIFYSKFPKISWMVMASIPLIIFLILFQASWTKMAVSVLNLLILLDIIRNIARAIIKKKDGAWIIGAGFILFILFFLVVAVAGITANKEIVANPGSTMAIVMLSTFVPGLVSIPLSMSIYLARDFARTNKDLEKQLKNVKALSEKTIKQEREKKKILENQKEKLEVMVKERTKELAQAKEKTNNQSQL